MFDNILNLFKRKNKEEVDKINKEKAKERLHLVLMQDRANVSADFLDLMKQEIIDVIKKYIDVDEDKIDVKLTNKLNGDGTTGAPALYANIPIKNIKKETRINSNKDVKKLEQIGNNSSVKVAETSKTTVATTKPEIKEDHSIVVDVPQSKVNSEAYTNNSTKQADNKTTNTNPQGAKADSINKASETTNTVKTSNTATVSVKNVTSTTNTVAKSVNSATTSANNVATDVKAAIPVNTDAKTSNIGENNSEVTADKNDNKVADGKEEKNDSNNKNGNNEKVEDNKTEPENKAIKMNKKKTTFFENVPRKKK